VTELQKKKVSYQLLEELNTKTRLRYLAKVTNPGVPRASGGDGHHDSQSDAAAGAHAAASTTAEEVRS
jgi:hypothetical protein